jgi:very-short-patch-repair endonuclease
VLSRGYHAKVQHKVGRYRIDMVIEGQGRRLAVECDGDGFHGPDRWEADRNRQAVLERLGWNFFRLRGSAYYRDPDLALSALWERLDGAGIAPAS